MTTPPLATSYRFRVLLLAAAAGLLALIVWASAQQTSSQQVIVPGAAVSTAPEDPSRVEPLDESSTPSAAPGWEPDRSSATFGLRSGDPAPPPSYRDGWFTADGQAIPENIPKLVAVCGADCTTVAGFVPRESLIAGLGAPPTTAADRSTVVNPGEIEVIDENGTVVGTFGPSGFRPKA
jgi:hypothetical protein